MTCSILDPANLPRRTYPSVEAGPFPHLLPELCSTLFKSLPRSDQRRRGLDYIQGLLAAHGRKSIRNIAARLGGQAAEQRLHHFISCSTWDWAPVREALAKYVALTAPPQAWVVRPMIIPKAGEHSVGVDRRFFSDLGQVRNAQHAIGIWAASEELRSPVNWRLLLSEAWLEDKERRSKAAIPEGSLPETVGDCVIDAYRQLVEDWGMPVRPLVFDASDLDATAVVARLRAQRIPFLVRISGMARLAVADPALTGHGTDVLPAQHIMRAARHRRRPVGWTTDGPDSTQHTSLVASVRVRLSGTTPAGIGRAGELALLTASDIGQHRATEMWLTNLPNTDPAVLLRLTRLVRSVDQDFTDVADQVGVRDFTGRSYLGWHRHVTLASAAHAVSVLANRPQRAVSQVS